MGKHGSSSTFDFVIRGAGVVDIHLAIASVLKKAARRLSCFRIRPKAKTVLSKGPSRNMIE
jgi:hypothetical protein